jgi:succinoglycan biosynthesis transport protein ExoP
MDGIQVHRDYAAPAVSSKSTPTALAINPAAVKTTSHYLRALRRRFWMVLAIAVPLAITGSILVLKLPPVYLAKGEIEINPPAIDPELSALMTHEPGRHDPSVTASYVPNQEARLRSRGLAQEVVGDPVISRELEQFIDPAFELFRSLNVLRLKNTNLFVVSLEGNDPARTKRLLEMLLLQLQKNAKLENDDKLDKVKQYAESRLEALVRESKGFDETIVAALGKTNTIGPGGRSILEERFVSLGSIMSQKRFKLGELQQQLAMAELMPKYDFDPEAGSRAARIAELNRVKKMYTRGLDEMRRHIRGFNNDPVVKRMAGQLDDVLDELEELKSIKKEKLPTPTEMILEQCNRELDADREEHDKLLAEMQKSIPEHQRILAMLKDREDRAQQIVRMKDRLMQFDILRLQVVNSPCVRIPSSVAEPTTPIKPNRPFLISLGIFLSFALGIGLVCLLEHIDYSVKIPEHASHGLTLPLLGVVPRIRRSSLTHRAGHLWTHATPDSIEADAYRNIRASLLGVADRKGPIVTLLVTSAKAGEGKSTTALNLAATCARAGERTLLLDVDLRRPSLAAVFIEQDPDLEIHGLVDVLRGELPWQRTVRHTELPNLDFIPTGDTRSIPIEILGTLELRQLLLALSHHYDRVILDGPAVLGLADCRVLGRIVDSSLLVVRSGAMQLITLHRAKAMLEQSGVAIAGVVFNGLSEDINNWSSYGYEPLSFSSSLAAPAGEPESLALVDAG